MISQPEIRPPPLPITWAVAGRPIAGEIESGDLHLVVPFAEGVLVGVMDGLGHGPDAADAARAAATALAQAPHDPVEDLMQRCHRALRRTRGVVLSLASIDAVSRRMTWLGVGNVEGALYRADGSARETIPHRSGVVGYEMPTASAATSAPGCRSIGIRKPSPTTFCAAMPSQPTMRWCWSPATWVAQHDRAAA